MNPKEELNLLTRIARSSTKERALCCPECGGEVILMRGKLICGCGWEGSSLLELEVKNESSG